MTPSISETAHASEMSSGKWSAIDHPYFYYDSGFKAFCHGELNELAKLKENWDGENAPPINKEILVSAAAIVDALPDHVAIRPQVVPVSSGSVQLEWRHGDRLLELELESPDEMHFLKWDPKEGIEEEDIVGKDDSTVLALIRWFMQGFFND